MAGRAGYLGGDAFEVFDFGHYGGQRAGFGKPDGCAMLQNVWGNAECCSCGNANCSQ